MTIREISNSPKSQGADEVIAYTLNTTPWGGYDSGATVVIKDSSGEDVSSTHLTGSPSESNDVITTPAVKSLVSGETYRLEIKWVYSGNTFETFCILNGET